MSNLSEFQSGESIRPLAVSVTDAAKLLGIGRTVTYELIRCGKLQTTNIGRRNMVRMASIRQLVDGVA
jgi:excisionase family DNA binding protein